jgi:hypothetical protein
MNPYRSLFGIALALTMLGAALPVKAQSPVSLRVHRPTDPFLIVEGGQAYIFRQGSGSTLEVEINVNASNRLFTPENLEAVWVGEQMRPGEFPSRIGPRVSILPTGGGLRRVPVREPVRLPADLFSCGRHNLRAVAEFSGATASERGNVASPEPATKVYLDCGPPTLEIPAPSGGACIRPRMGIDLRLTASDDIGIMSLTLYPGALKWHRLGHTTLERTFAHVLLLAAEDSDRNGVTSATFEVEDWVGNRTAKGFTFTLDGDAPPTIGFDQPGEGQQVTQVDSIPVSGQAADPGCGLDRIEIGARRRVTADPYRVLKTIREFPSARPNLPTPRFTYRADLPPGTLIPGLWDLRAEAISQTGRRAGSTRHIRVIGGPTLAPSPPGARPLLPGVPPPVKPFPIR